jgi:Flagellar biosynthesis regulator FlaF
LTAAARARAGEGGEAAPLAAAKCEAEALFENERLWTSLLTDLAAEENQLPVPLRAQLISLGIWACRYIDKIRFRKASYAPLIEVNTQMIAGLTASLEASRGPAATVAAPALGTTEPMFT